MLQKTYIFILFIFSLNVGFSQTTITSGFEIDGLERTYRIYIPDIYNADYSTPLVLNLHGYGSNGLEQEVYGDFRAIADTANFIIVSPDGALDGFGVTHWNTFGTSSVDDVNFLSALIDTVASRYSIDHSRVYSTGMSNGGFMSYKLACQLSGRIAAVASVTGTMTVAEFDDCMTNHPMPVMQIHGTDDPTVAYEGSAFFKSVDQIIEHWVDFNECNPEPINTEVPDTDEYDSSTVTHFLYEGGLLGSTIELYRINNGEHTWPGAMDFGMGITNQDIDASKEIWRFFSQYTLGYLTSAVEEIENSSSGFTCFPNPSNTGQINLKFDENTTAKKIEVFNSLGQNIINDNTNQPNYTFNVNSPGIYLITVIDNGILSSQKVVVN